MDSSGLLYLEYSDHSQPSFYIPHIDDTLDCFYQVHYLSKLDLFSGYHQIRIEEGHQHKTASLLWWGLYEYTVTPLGLINVPATF